MTTPEDAEAPPPPVSYWQVPSPVPAPAPVRALSEGVTAIRRSLLIAAAASLVVGAGALRSAVSLGPDLDPDLLSAPDAAGAAAAADVGRLVLVVVGVTLLVRGRRWSRRVRARLAVLAEHRALTAASDATAASAATTTATAGAEDTTSSSPVPQDAIDPLFAPIATPHELWSVQPVRASRRTALSAVGLTAVAVALIAGSSVGLALATTRDAAQALWLGLAVGGLLLVPATALLSWVVGDIERREAVADRLEDPLSPAPPEPARRWASVAIALLAVLAAFAPAAGGDQGANSDRVCIAIDVECEWMVVQADQRDGGPHGATTGLHFGLHRATGTRLGTMIIATGGPGVSGLAAWNPSYPYLDARLTAAYDLVVFDARGVGGSGYHDCPGAASRFSEAFGYDAGVDAIKIYVDACLVEAGVGVGQLSSFGSDQVIEDMEAIRRRLGVEAFVVYGQSYGTAVAQRYAMGHPDHVQALILDAPLDITQPIDDFWAEATASFEDILARTLRDCRFYTDCLADLPDPERAWDEMLDQLRTAKPIARYADVDGDVVEHEFDVDQVLAAIADAMYSEDGRTLVLRAVAGAAHRDWVPLGRLTYNGQGSYFGPLESVSDFAYHATWCADRVVVGVVTDPATYLAEAREAGLDEQRMGGVYLSGAPCHAWPIPPAPAPPSTLPSGADFPVMILSATGDPITPIAIARRIAERYRATTDTYLFETQAGPHVTFGRGAACPDEAVLDLLLEGKAPDKPVTRCEGDLVSAYVPRLVQGEGEDGLSYRGRALDLELLVHPDYRIWDRVGTLTIGCRYGGRMVVTRDTDLDRIDVDGCEVILASPMKGAGVYRDDGTVRWEVSFPRGQLVYEADVTGFVIKGELDGVKIDTTHD